MIFQKINKDIAAPRNGAAAATDPHASRHRDPFHISPAPKSRAVLTTEEKEILTHCTFHPQVLTKAGGSTPSTNRTLFDGPKQETAPRRSPVRPVSPSSHLHARSTTPQLATPSESPLFEELRAKSPSGKRMQRDEISSLTSRLYDEARRKEERMQAARHRHETVDPKTGRPLYRPFVGR